MTIPNQIMKLDKKELDSLREFLQQGVAFKRLCNSCYEVSRDNMLKRKPQGINLDMYNWGFFQGINETHEMYKNLLDIVIQELENRKEELTKDKLK